MRLLRVWLVAATVFLAACAPAGVGPGELASRPPIPRDAFIASYAHGAGDVGGGNGDYLTAFDRRTGARLVDLLHFGPNDNSVALTGYSRQSDGAVVYATAHPPVYPRHGGLSGGPGTPEPGSCGGVVHRMAVDGTVTTLFEVPDTAQLRSPAVNGDGTKVAYATADCSGPADPSVAVPWTITVRNLADGATTSLTMPGTDLGPPTWNADGTQLAFGLSTASTAPMQVTDARYAVVPADLSGVVPAGQVRTLPGVDCFVTSIVFDRAGLVLAQNCQTGTDTTARLLQFDGTSTKVAWRATVHACSTERFVQIGALSADPVSGDLLLSASAHCNDPSGGPSDVVQRWTGQHSIPIGRYLNPEAFVSQAIW